MNLLLNSKREITVTIFNNTSPSRQPIATLQCDSKISPNTYLRIAPNLNSFFPIFDYFILSKGHEIYVTLPKTGEMFLIEWQPYHYISAHVGRRRTFPANRHVAIRPSSYCGWSKYLFNTVFMPYNRISDILQVCFGAENVTHLLYLMMDGFEKQFVYFIAPRSFIFNKGS